jgi:hypothetical protein
MKRMSRNSGNILTFDLWHRSGGGIRQATPHIWGLSRLDLQGQHNKKKFLGGAGFLEYVTLL